MKSRVWRGLAVCSLAVLVCTAFALNDQNVQTTDKATEVIAPEPQSSDDCIAVTHEELMEMGYGQIDIEPHQVACVMTVDGYMRFQTVAKGKWSAFGWCGPGDPDMSPCACVYPPLKLCILPSRPSFESVIRDVCVWEDFWAAHSFGPMPTPPPEIDFDNYAVIAVVLGERDSCGYEVTITSIRLTDCGVRVRINECVQLWCTPRIVNPYHFVKIPKSCIPFSRRICFDHGGLEPAVAIERKALSSELE
ncbi:MAG: protease complex subunit PrcB family protein [Phycisphaerae bacterium]|nr:protease complex subunit PrcB family protein [Phycisphaerae bacterium]